MKKQGPSFSISIQKGPIENSIELPRSKSHTTRLLILASLVPQLIVILNPSKSTDVKNLIKCLKQIGLKIIEKNNSIAIENSFPSCERKNESNITLSPGNGGTTNRFLLCLLSLGKKKYNILMNDDFSKRPIKKLYEVLNSLRVNIIKNAYGITLQGPCIINTTFIDVDCSKTTQFASALKMILFNKKIKVNPCNMCSSQTYLDLTSMLIKEIKKGKKKFETPYDMSSLAWPLALGLMVGPIYLPDIVLDENQPDNKILSIVKEMGGIVKIKKNSLQINRSENLLPLNIDCSNFLDLVPALSFLCAHIEGTSCLKNIKNLIVKESNRIDEISRLLNLFNRECRYDKLEESLIIKGKKTVERSVDYNAPSDHRIIMTAFLFMKYHNGGKIFNYQHVNKSWPDFFNEVN